MRVIVTGSRDWTEYEAVYDALDELTSEHEVITVVHGACPHGADFYASFWANTAGGAGITEEPHPADWNQFGRRAGPIRNAEMVKAGADLVLAFPSHGGKGTQHMIRIAREAGVPVQVWGDHE